MHDFFQSRRFGREAESLYTYSTLMRMVYQHDQTLWQQLVDEVDLCTSFEDHPAAGPIVPGWCILRGKTGCIVVIEGTTNPLQYVLEFYGAELVPASGFPGEVAVNFFTVYLNLRAAIMAAIPAGQHDNITVLGHSLGGTLALYLGFELSTAYPTQFNGIITEGAPFGGNLPFAQGMTFPILRIENDGDPVPGLPPSVNLLVRPQNAGSVFSLTGRHFAPAGGFYLMRSNGEVITGYGFDPSGGYPPPSIPFDRGQIDNAATFVHNTEEYARRLRVRLMRAPGLRRLSSPQRVAMDRINAALNVKAGLDWALDVPSGRPRVWLSEVLGPAPTTRPLVNAVDP